MIVEVEFLSTTRVYWRTNGWRFGAHYLGRLRDYVDGPVTVRRRRLRPAFPEARLSEEEQAIILSDLIGAGIPVVGFE